MTVYLLHFSTPIAHAKHYIGFTKNSAEERFLEHANGKGARLTQVAVERGIAFHIAKVWKRRSRKFERWLKNQKGGAYRTHCPFCRGERELP